MRCKQHYTDHSSTIGVCASCLRERLFYLVAAQEHAQLYAQTQSQTLEDRNRNLETHPVFPRSVSPYITRRKSDTASSIRNQRKGDTNRHRNVPDQRFFSTPQVGGYNNNNSNSNNIYNNQKKKHSFIRFNLLSKLFRSRKQKDLESDSDPRFSVSDSRGSCGGGGGGGDSATPAMSSPFRFSNIRTGSRKKQPVCVSECSTRAGTRKQYCSDRGMSPVRLSDCGGVEDEFYDGSSGYETCESRKQTPWRTPAHPTVRRGGGIGSFCLSPLVRASPCRLWNLPAADGGDTRAPVKPHLSNTKSFCANRSRKLADFGRFNSNR